MDDNKKKYQHIIDKLISNGVYKEEAEAMTDMVMNATKECRVDLLSNKLNQRVTVEIGGLLVDVFIHDIKYTDEGLQFQVQPIAGSKMIWVKRYLTR